MVAVAIQTPPEHQEYGVLRDLWQAADGLGFRAAFTFDHLVPLNPGERPGAGGGAERRGPQLEGWITLAALAAGTSRLEVGTLVTGVTYRHPAMLAKMAVTLDHVTGGRAILGVGAAWHEEEHRMFGIPFPPVGERMDELADTLEMFAALTHADGPVTWEGRRHRLDRATFEPLPVRPGGIPVLVGGSGPRLKRIAARHASLFNSFNAPWEWGALNAELDELLAAAGRPPEALERTAFVFSDLSGDPAREADLVAHFQRTRGGTEEEVRRRVVLSGDPEAAAAVLRSYAEAGVSMVVLNIRPGTTATELERFATEVLPALG